MELLNVNIPNWSDLGNWIPEAVLCVGFLAALLGDLLVRGRKPAVPFAISVFTLITAGSYAVAGLNDPGLAAGYAGVLPALPDKGAYDRKRLAEYLAEAAGKPFKKAADTYWAGKTLGTIGNLIPIAEQVGRVLYNGAHPREAVLALMTREAKPEA